MFCHTPPVNTLPVELLSYIFLISTHVTDPECNLPFTTESIKAPLIISSVNKHWRNTALNTPSLWTSLCVTAEMVRSQEDHDISLFTSGVFDTGHLTTYIQRSRKYPLDILIDARDQDWDFSEPEIPSEYECDTYTPPFSSAHMSTAISLLLPHLSRWRSISILTDSWAPMYVALQQIQPVITTLGAPRLESLSLMRCNDFVSYSSAFQPNEMKGPAFLTLDDEHSARSLLPRLKNLTLRGVHVDWSSLASILSQSHTDLRTLELASHCLDVRPSFPEFHHLLSVVSSLDKLVINGSGPYLPDDAEEDEGTLNDDELGPISFPNLTDITIGYRSAYEGQTILEFISAPNTRVLTLEDSTYPGDPEDVDAGKLLTYVGTGRFHDANQHIFVSYINGRHYEVALDDNSKIPINCLVQKPTDAGSSGPTCPFPLLEAVTLNRVKACPGPLHAFFSGLQNVRKLELSGMSAHAIHALRPYGNPSHCPCLLPTTSPCPDLQSLCIRRPEFTQLQDFIILIGGLAVERVRKGACGLREVDIYVDETSEGVEEGVVRVSPCTTVTIFREGKQDGNEDGVEDDGAVDPFQVGGAFNDLTFDAFYSGNLAHTF